jgi:U4/U6.U5 tri-snRNP-associated protein 3
MAALRKDTTSEAAEEIAVKEAAAAEEEFVGLSEEEQMAQMMGFNGFDSTKGKTVSDNLSSSARGAVQKHKGRKYRQYMNRKGGFNKPLQKM